MLADLTILNIISFLLIFFIGLPHGSFDGAVAALLPPEEFRCDFTQTMGGAYVDSTRWAFIFPHSEQDKSFSRQNTEDFIRWTREGQYTLTLFQSGEKPNEPGGF